MTPVRAYIGIGANLGNPEEQVRSAIRALAGLPVTRVVACSSLYRTAPVGVAPQPDFVNAVCAVDTELGPERLLAELLEIERAHGRMRAGEWGTPRTLDLDLLLHGDLCLEEPALRLPHPRLHERAFVLYPLAEIAPTLVVPGRGPISELVRGCTQQRITRLEPAAPAAEP